MIRSATPACLLHRRHGLGRGAAKPQGFDTVLLVLTLGGNTVRGFRAGRQLDILFIILHLLVKLHIFIWRHHVKKE